MSWKSKVKRSRHPSVEEALKDKRIQATLIINSANFEEFITDATEIRDFLNCLLSHFETRQRASRKRAL